MSTSKSRSKLQLQGQKQTFISLSNVQEQNLKNIDVHIPKGKITVVTGVSGSGKSTLAFNTLYAEGQRRYLQSLPSYARMFFHQMKKPEVESIKGICPSIAIDQKTVVKSFRSTLGTMTGVYDCLRLLFTKLAVPYCPKHHLPLRSQSKQEIIHEILSYDKALYKGKNKDINKSNDEKSKEADLKEARFYILAPVARAQKGTFAKEFRHWEKMGFTRVRVDGKWNYLYQMDRLSKNKMHHIDLLIDQLILKPQSESFCERLRLSIDKAISLSSSHIKIEWLDQHNNPKENKTYSLHSVCEKCGLNFPPVDMKFLSFNHTTGACKYCHGIGLEGLERSSSTEDDLESEFLQFWEEEESTPLEDSLGEEDTGNKSHGPSLEQLGPCPHCHGSRLNELARSIYLKEKNLAQLTQYSLTKLYTFLTSLHWTPKEKIIAEKILEKTLHLISSLQKMGLSYLNLGRATASLSGGEAQRARLAAQLGSELIGVLYVLDEPSIGLHPRDHRQLLSLLRELQSRGNTLVVVEHDAETILSADHIIDLGPGAGHLGGHIIDYGSPTHIKKRGKGLTAEYLRGEKLSCIPTKHKQKSEKFLSIYGAKKHNLKSINVHIPLERLVGVSGVSGSGKSTLIMDILYRALAIHFHKSFKSKPKSNLKPNSNLKSKSKSPSPPSLLPPPQMKSDSFKKIHGVEFIEKVIKVDQRPIGRTSRSIPATYVHIFSLIRELFANLPESRVHGYSPGHFSFNSRVQEGRCPHCKGLGQIHLQMKMMSDTTVICDYCQGKRFRKAILQIKYRDKSIADILNMSIGEALEFFKNHSLIFKKLSLLQQVGLSYLRLGQVSNTLSGGESQRIKLSREMGKHRSVPTLYILDEPTTGLHFDDTRRLLLLLQGLTDRGNSVIIIEHNLDVLMSVDHLIDLGPEGGVSGGHLIASATPQEVMKCKKSFTGKYLYEMKQQMEKQNSKVNQVNKTKRPNKIKQVKNQVKQTKQVNKLNKSDKINCLLS